MKAIEKIFSKRSIGLIYILLLNAFSLSFVFTSVLISQDLPKKNNEINHGDDKEKKLSQKVRHSDEEIHSHSKNVQYEFRLDASLEIAKKQIAEEENEISYNRREWHHWVKAKGDCQNTRQKVLIRDSLEPVTFKNNDSCHVLTGKWRCPYTGEMFAEAKPLDIDHVVPLAEAHRSGGYKWSFEQKENYANDMSYSYHLLSVKNSVNRAKGDKDPAHWLPQKDICNYIYTWVQIKNKYKLNYDGKEFSTIEDKWKTCSRHVK